MDEKGGIRVLDRAISILDHMARNEDKGGITDIAEATGLPKATVHRILQGLHNKRVVVQGDDGTYSIGPAVLAWADAFRTRVVLPKLAQPTLRRLWEGTKETVHLVAYDGEVAYYVDKLESPHPVGMRSRIGAEICLHTTAAGRSILASLSDGEIRRYGDHLEGRREGAPSVYDPEKISQMVESARLRGFASENEENEEGIRCVGAAILQGDDRRPVGAVSVSIPAYRLDDSDVAALGEAVREAAEEISRLINRR